VLIFDIETDGLLNETTKVHCISVLDVDTGKLNTYSERGNYPRISEGLRSLVEADCICGHNILTFDLPALHKVYRNFVPKGKVLDTLTLSRLVWPNLAEIDFDKIRHAKTPSDPYFHFPTKLVGSHSLRAWGYRLGVLKGDFSETTDWQEWSEEMCSYNRQDVVVTKALYDLICKQHYSEEAINLEHEFQKVIFQQEQNGFPFDTEKAATYYGQLASERSALELSLQKVFPPKDRGSYFVPKRDNRSRGYTAGVPVWRPKLTPFNPGSRQDIAERLKEKYNWEPTEFTDKGVPKVDEDVLNQLDYPEAKDLSRFFLLQKRIGQLAEGNNAWLKLVQPDGRIHGHVITNGAVTGRCTHTHPNMAQVPAVGVPWGAEFRSLFYAPDGWSVLGADASGLELRCLAHYMARYDGGAYAQKILEGDIHWHNAQALGLVGKDETKDPNNEHHMWARNKVAKRFIYAFMYGAGDGKLGEIVGGDETKGAELRKTFLRALPAMRILIDKVKQTAKERGYLLGIDKRRLPVRSQHSALNTLLQSAGAIAIKKATCILWDDLRAEGLNQYVQQVAHVHDEYQLLVKKGYEEDVGRIAVDAFRRAGEYFHFRIPLDGEYKVGRNWAETH